MIMLCPLATRASKALMTLHSSLLVSLSANVDKLGAKFCYRPVVCCGANVFYVKCLVIMEL